MAGAGPEFDTLVNDLLTDPEGAQKVVDNLDLEPEDLARLVSKLNPHVSIGGPPRDPEKPRLAALAYTNLREDFIRRFTMTGMVGFLFQMLKEWETPVESRRWTPPRLARKAGKAEPFTLSELRTYANEINAMVEQAEIASGAFEKLQEEVQQYGKERATFTEEEMVAVRRATGAKPLKGDSDVKIDAEKEASVGARVRKLQELLSSTRSAEDDLWGIRYGITALLRNAGIEADIRTPATEKAAMQFSGTRAKIESDPDRHKSLLPAGAQEFPKDRAKQIITEFLQNYFEFDPSAHVRGAYDQTVIEPKLERRDVAGLPERVFVDPFDEDRLPFRTLVAKTPPRSTVEADGPHLKMLLNCPAQGRQQHMYNTLCHLLGDPAVQTLAEHILGGPAAGDPDRLERWRRMMLPEIVRPHVPAVPPQDTFHRWNYYMEVNMEALRVATESIYHEKPGIDFALGLMDYHQADSPDDARAWGEKFRDENQDRVSSDIKVVEFGAWTLLGDFEGNRKNINFFNRHTDILERILKRHEEDKKMGSLLMRQRVRKAKAANIKEAGPDAPGLAEYRGGEFNAVAATGAQEALSATDRLRLERAQGDLKAARELEYYDEHKRTVDRLTAEGNLRELKKEEKAELDFALAEMEKAREMHEVPDDAIQVDVWNVSHEKGTFDRTKMYTKAVKLDEAIEDLSLTRNNAKVLAAREAKDPYAAYPPSARKAAREARARGQDAPPLAPFAQDFLAQEEAQGEGAPDAAPAAAGAKPPAPLGAEAIDAAIAAMEKTR